MIIVSADRKKIYFEPLEIFVSTMGDSNMIRIVNGGIKNTSGMPLASYATTEDMNVAWNYMLKKITNASPTSVIYTPNEHQIREIQNHREEHARNGAVLKRTGGS